MAGEKSPETDQSKRLGIGDWRLPIVNRSDFSTGAVLSHQKTGHSLRYDSVTSTPMGSWQLAIANYWKSSSLVHWEVLDDKQALFGFRQTKNFVIG
jgi:hypothetical protein